MKWLFVYLFFTGTEVSSTIEQQALTNRMRPISSVEQCIEYAHRRQNAINEVLLTNPLQEGDPEYVLVICRENT